ncbi:MAG: phage holin family protein [Streptosporangiaceae bacterium]
MCRWHRIIEDAGLAGDITELELLSFPRYAPLKTEDQEQGWIERSPDRYLAVMHMPLSSANPLVQLEKAIVLAPENEEGQRQREQYANLLGPGFQIGSQVRRAQSVTVLTHRNKLELPTGAPPHWTPETSWLWYAASTTRLNTFCPDTNDPHLLDGLVYLSTSWRSLVLRDGISFISLMNDDEPEGTGFFPWAEAYVRSLYIDVALLAALQRDGLNDFANRLARIGNRFEKSAEFRRLINEMTEFRNVFWWDHVTHHGAANEILLRLHDAHRTPELFDWITADLDAFKQQVEAQALEASVRIQELEEKRARTFEHTASIAAIAFALPALIFAALTVPIRGLTSDGHNIPGWAVLVVGTLALITGALAGAIGGHWLSRRT